MADVGRGSVIGAGSIVTRALPERSIAVGSPAKAVGRRGGGRAAEPETVQPGSGS
jgi:acetyltransferase-like isoleucine patch superfamily enzyme